MQNFKAVNPKGFSMAAKYSFNPYKRDQGNAQSPDGIYKCIIHTKTVQLRLNFEIIQGSEEEIWTLLGIVNMIFNPERFKGPPNEVDLTEEKWLYGECRRLIERKKSKERGEFKPYWELEEPSA